MEWLEAWRTGSGLPELPETAEEILALIRSGEVELSVEVLTYLTLRNMGEVAP